MEAPASGASAPSPSPGSAFESPVTAQTVPAGAESAGTLRLPEKRSMRFTFSSPSASPDALFIFILSFTFSTPPVTFMKQSLSPSSEAAVLNTLAANSLPRRGSVVYRPSTSRSSVIPSAFRAEPNMHGIISPERTAAAISASVSSLPSRTVSASSGACRVTASVNSSVLSRAPLKSASPACSSEASSFRISSFFLTAISILFTKAKTGMFLSLSRRSSVFVCACTPSDPLITRRA